MKFNTTYIQKINLKDTIKEIEFIKKELIDLIKSHYKLTEVSIPIYLEEDDERVIDLKEVTRDVSYDLLNNLKIVKNLISPSNYMRDLLDRLEISKNHGLISFGKYTYRDLKETPTTTVVKDEICIQIKVENKEDAINQINSINELIYSKIYALAKYVEKKYKLENIFEKNTYFVYAQDLENETPNLTTKEREINLSLEQNAFFLVNPGKKLHSGKRHSNIPITIYDQSHFYQLILKDRINVAVLKPIQIALLSNGTQLSDQLSLYDIEHFKKNTFYEKLTHQNYKVIEIKFNVPRIVMALLAKGHISEVQPGVISDEVSLITQKYKVESY